MHGQQGDQIRKFRIPPPRIRQQPRQPPRRIRRQIEQLHGRGQLLLTEPAVIRGGDEIRLRHLRPEMFPLLGRRQQNVDKVPHANGHRRTQPGPASEERVRDPDRLLQRQRHYGRQEMPVEVYPRRGHRRGERLPVLLGTEQRPGLQKPRLKLRVPTDAVLDDVDQLGRPPLLFGILGLVTGLADVGQDRVLVAIPVSDMVEGLGDHVRHGVEPVHRADVAPRGVQRAPERLRVLHRPVPGLLRGELRVGEPTPADQHLQLDLGGDLRAGDVGVEGAHQDVDGLVGRPEVDAAAVAGDLFDQLEVVVAAHICAVLGERAVDRAEASVDAADVDQVLQDPAGHALVLGDGTLGGLGGDARDEPGHYLVVVRAGVEVHVQGDQVDGGEGHLGHAVDRVLAGQVGLAYVEVVQRRGARERAQPPRQSLVGGRARGGARPRAELGRNAVRRCRRSHVAQPRSSV